MSYSIVYSSQTGNTAQLAHLIKKLIPEKECIYEGMCDEKAKEADTIFVGFWTDKGNCQSEIAQFLADIRQKKIFLFGTAGFGGTEDYFSRILVNVEKNIGTVNQIVGEFMCIGKMPITVRERYEKMGPLGKTMIENFDLALTHPDQSDLVHLTQKVTDTLKL